MSIDNYIIAFYFHKRWLRMEKDMKQAIIDLLEKLKSTDYISPDTIPNIDLYMDQITSFMEIG